MSMRRQSLVAESLPIRSLNVLCVMNQIASLSDRSAVSHPQKLDKTETLRTTPQF